MNTYTHNCLWFLNILQGQLQNSAYFSLPVKTVLEKAF